MLCIVLYIFLHEATEKICIVSAALRLDIWGSKHGFCSHWGLAAFISGMEYCNHQQRAAASPISDHIQYNDAHHPSRISDYFKFNDAAHY